MHVPLHDWLLCSFDQMSTFTILHPNCDEKEKAEEFRYQNALNRTKKGNLEESDHLDLKCNFAGLLQMISLVSKVSLEFSQGVKLVGPGYLI